MAKSMTLAKCEELQHLFETSSGEITVGIDLGDRYSHCCVLGPDGVVFAEGRRADHTGRDGEPFRECASGPRHHRGRNAFEMGEPVIPGLGS